MLQPVRKSHRELFISFLFGFCLLFLFKWFGLHSLLENTKKGWDVSLKKMQRETRFKDTQTEQELQKMEWFCFGRDWNTVEDRSRT